MKNIVLKDVNPDKVLSLSAFLKEMNDFTVLVTNANGPIISEVYVTTNEQTGIAQFKLTEEEYTATLEAKVDGDEPSRVNFMILEGTKCLFQAKYTVRETPYYALQVILNCDAENLVKDELIKCFQRDFSAEAHADMKKTLDELRPLKPEEKVKKVETDDALFAENEALIKSFTAEPQQRENVTVEAEKDTTADTTAADNKTSVEEDEVAIELENLSEQLLGAIEETDKIIDALNAISHDLTRGGSINFSQQPLLEQQLENGATIYAIDLENDEYRITFRKGVVEEAAEISFFLERQEELIFSVYLSSDGYGKIAAQGANGEFVVQQVKARLVNPS